MVKSYKDGPLLVIHRVMGPLQIALCMGKPENNGDSPSLNPMSTSNFLDEDMMKAMRGVAKACHPKTVKHAWARRYLLKKVIAWSQGGGKTKKAWQSQS